MLHIIAAAIGRRRQKADLCNDDLRAVPALASLSVVPRARSQRSLDIRRSGYWEPFTGTGASINCLMLPLGLQTGATPVSAFGQSAVSLLSWMVCRIPIVNRGWKSA